MKKNFLKKMFPLFNKRYRFSHLQNPKRSFKWFLRRGLVYLGYFFLGMILLTSVLFAWYSKDLPTPAKIAQRRPAVSTKIYDRTGEILLYETGDQKRTVVKSDQISDYLKKATIAAEDAKFYEHNGFDFRGIFIAISETLLGKTRRTRGASTITQQYVKNALLTSDRSLARKIKEAILTVQMEFMFDKEEILTMYLNEIPYGSGTAGAEAASKIYYGIPAKDLTLAQAATLASIPQAPTFYSPYGTNIERLNIRRDYVLDLMVKNKMITKEEAEAAKAIDTTTIGVAVKPRSQSILAPHFSMYVLEEIANQFGEEKIQKEGLKIITTLDYDKQKAAEDAIVNTSAQLKRTGAGNAALVAVDPKSGEVLSMVGSKDYFDTSIQGNVNVTTSLRQPGSSIKPITYAALFKQKEYSPSKNIFDLKTDFGNYIPQNNDGNFRGPVTIRQALATSLNIPAVKALGLVGIDNFIRTAEDFGYTTFTQKDRYGLSLALGAAEVKPIEMASAFSAFANQGTKYDYTPILQVIDYRGKTIYDIKEENRKAKKVIDPQIAYEIAHILSDNEARTPVFGARSQLYFPNRTVAAKTGTTSDFKDAWVVGFTPSLSVAVWVGNSRGEPMYAKAYGSTTAAPIFNQYITNALKDTGNEDFVRPSGIREVKVERYSNKLPNQHSTEFITDIFASWQVPTETDDVNKIVRICRGTDLLAPENLDAKYVEERVYRNINSEMPSNPNWEGPVRAWAEARGMTSVVPKDYCDVNKVSSSITITSPQSGASISEEGTIKTTISSYLQISKVEFFIDDQKIGETTTSPYEYRYDFSKLTAGSHRLKVIATDQTGFTVSDEIPILVNTELKISNVVTKTTTTGSGSIESVVTFSTNLSAIYTFKYGIEGQSTQEVSGSNYQTSHLVTVKNLLPNKKYVFTIEVKDQLNSSSSSQGSFNTP